jgi:hypothetical protein
MVHVGVAPVAIKRDEAVTDALEDIVAIDVHLSRIVVGTTGRTETHRASFPGAVVETERRLPRVTPADVRGSLQRGVARRQEDSRPKVLTPVVGGLRGRPGRRER